MNQEIHFCTCPDGARIAYALSGRGAPLVRAQSEEAIRKHADAGGFPANRIARITSVIDPTTAR